MLKMNGAGARRLTLASTYKVWAVDHKSQGAMKAAISIVVLLSGCSQAGPPMGPGLPLQRLQ